MIECLVKILKRNNRIENRNGLNQLGIQRKTTKALQKKKIAAKILEAGKDFIAV